MCMFFFFNDTATTEIYTLSLHDALPIFGAAVVGDDEPVGIDVEERDGEPLGCEAVTEGPGHDLHDGRRPVGAVPGTGDRKSTRLNSSHGYISYAVFCLKKKINEQSTATS